MTIASIKAAILKGAQQRNHEVVDRVFIQRDKGRSTNSMFNPHYLGFDYFCDCFCLYCELNRLREDADFTFPKDHEFYSNSLKSKLDWAICDAILTLNINTECEHIGKKRYNRILEKSKEMRAILRPTEDCILHYSDEYSAWRYVPNSYPGSYANTYADTSTSTNFGGWFSDY
ncbi:hypothetical protein LCGC14_2621500 [marine sediment metagenome]|uniref:Uncharacterized protein n=1 Tax=marine sediment metagenome TaxID=412755 RepID=A0A0F9CDZ4_9ZZZZ